MGLGPVSLHIQSHTHEGEGEVEGHIRSLLRAARAYVRRCYGILFSYVRHTDFLPRCIETAIVTAAAQDVDGYGIRYDVAQMMT